MMERLQKWISRAGVASRRHAEDLMRAGRVTVNGRVVKEMGTQVDSGRDEVRVDGTLVAEVDDRVYYLFYKPSGCVTTLSDPEGRPTVRQYLRTVKERVYPVGRLDYDAEGVLLFTNDGTLAHRLMHPRYGVTRTYLAKVKGIPTPAVIEQLRAGVRLDDGMARPQEAELVSRADKNTWIRLVVDEGRPHLIKRLCEAVGHPVQRLYRSQYAGIEVEGMMPGEVRQLSTAEVRALKAVVATEKPRGGGAGKPKASVNPSAKAAASKSAPSKSATASTRPSGESTRPSRSRDGTLANGDPSLQRPRLARVGRYGKVEGMDVSLPPRRDARRRVGPGPRPKR